MNKHLKLISLVFISGSEAKRTPSPRSNYTAKQTAKITRTKAVPHPKGRVTFANQSRRPPVVMKKTQQRPQVTLRRQFINKTPQRQRPTPTVKRNQQRQTRVIRPYQKVVSRRLQKPRAFPLRTNQCYQASVHTKPFFASSIRQDHHHQPLVARNNRSCTLLLVPRGVQSKPSAHQQLNYFELLNVYMQENARIGKLDRFFAQNLLGQGQTIALIEVTGTWDELRNAINYKGGGYINGYVQENYRRNFLLPIGGPGADPNAILDKSFALNKHKEHNHGSQVASVLLDFAPRAKILPVSTYLSPSGQSYDMADALMDLAKKPDVKVINLSSGSYDSAFKVTVDENYNVKHIFTFSPKYVATFKAVAKAGKVIVIAAGNEGIALDTANDPHPIKYYEFEKLVLHILENLDPDTRQSIILAGNLDPNRLTIDESSSRPGKLTKLQDCFLFAPGEVQFSYGGYNAGTSYSAPYICAALANLLSRSNNITPRQAVKVLLETAEQRPERHVYGRGIIRADRALEALERDLARR